MLKILAYLGTDATTDKNESHQESKNSSDGLLWCQLQVDYIILYYYGALLKFTYQG